MSYQLSRVILVIVLVILATISQTPAQTSASPADVDSMLKDFHRTLFYDMKPPQAIKNHFFLETMDAIDTRSGLEHIFPDTTKRVKAENKLKVLVAGVYFLLDIAPIQVKLGTLDIGSKPVTNFSTTPRKEFLEIRSQTLSNLGLTEDDLEKQTNVDDKNIPLISEYLNELNAAILKKANRQLVNQNLRFISEHSTLKKEIFEGREYFIVENPIFIYKIAIKNGSPKIMYMNRNPKYAFEE